MKDHFPDDRFDNPYQSPEGDPTFNSGEEPSAAALRKVAGPAIALLVLAIFGMGIMVVGVMVIVLMIAAVAADAGGQMGPQKGPQFLVSGAQLFGQGVAITVQFAVSIVILLGALKMKQLESYPLAMTAAILAMLPCFSPCCLLGLPLGIWALVVLNDPDVQSAFR